ncbi:MAG: hypothetical protein M1827_000737 [Pycnora praestabilis]|nr:MAG: hypothetical protein M1827_000737 [Pycnora praestabilis]
MAPIPITIITGFLGSGKTTLILNLIPQLPPSHKLALLKNEFGDVAIDSQLATSSAISGVQELLNGCICCNLVGQLSDALDTLRRDVAPDRIIVETSGSAFPATLAMEVNRLGRESGNYVLDGVVVVIDVENWAGYEDTSFTAKLQARYTDVIVFNKWEEVGERRWDECLDRVGDMGVDVAWVKSKKGWVDRDVVLGIDGGLARELSEEKSLENHREHHEHEHAKDHSSEVEVLSVNLSAPHGGKGSVDLEKLQQFLQSAPKDEIYRIKAVLSASEAPKSSDQELNPTTPKPTGGAATGRGPSKYILNWAFGRWTFTPLLPFAAESSSLLPLSEPTSRSTTEDTKVLRMTIIMARYESMKWKKRIEAGGLMALANGHDDEKSLVVERLL